MIAWNAVQLAERYFRRGTVSLDETATTPSSHTCAVQHNASSCALELASLASHVRARQRAESTQRLEPNARFELHRRCGSWSATSIHSRISAFYLQSCLGKRLCICKNLLGTSDDMLAIQRDTFRMVQTAAYKGKVT